VKIKWLQNALFDLEEVEAYIAKDNPTAAISTVLKIINSVGYLSKQSGIGRLGRIPGTKELIIHNTPFIVPYRVKDGEVQILRVYHKSRRWPQRF
jgi:addiction module RelE/StbE family toxin